MANVYILFLLVRGFRHLHRFGIIAFGNESPDFVQFFTVDIEGFHTGNMCFIGLFQDFFHYAFAKDFAMIIHEVNFALLIYEIFDGEEEPVFFQVISENRQPGTLIHAIHATNAFLKINLRNRAGAGFGNGAVRTGKLAGIAGKTIQAVNLNIRFGNHAFRVRKIRLFNDFMRMLLRVNIFF